MGAHTLLDARENQPSPTDHMSSSRGIRTREAVATIQPPEPVDNDLSGGHSTGIETMSTGAGAGNRQQRAAYLDPPVSRDFVSLNQHPEVQKAMRDLVIATHASQFFINNRMEPNLGSHAAAVLMAVNSGVATERRHRASTLSSSKAMGSNANAFGAVICKRVNCGVRSTTFARNTWDMNQLSVVVFMPVVKSGEFTPVVISTYL
jgi:hypothetical protein